MKRVIMEESTIFFLSMVVLTLLGERIVCSSSISPPNRCGCIEKDDLASGSAPLASMVLGNLHSDMQMTKCDLFCSTKSGDRFVKSDMGICGCFKDLLTFDCDEVLTAKSSPSVLPVYCVSSPSLSYYFNFSEPLPFKREQHQSNASRDVEAVTELASESNEDLSVGKGIAPAAIVLGVFSLVVLVLLGVKTWCDNQRSKVKTNESEKTPKRSESTWNFNEDKIKETRFENNV